MIEVRLAQVHGAPHQQRFCFYEVRRDGGPWQEWGPLITHDPQFDPQAHVERLKAKLERDQ